ncbi:hypothetical protein PWT90_03028 [Aphanocladium album]|nr:hypothetical protein PWT90_03028 [Aphanocladium album]
MGVEFITDTPSSLFASKCVDADTRALVMVRRESAAKTDDSRQAGKPAAETSGAMAEAPRKKKWHSKTRTGCSTCRTRRVKCDEGRPTCWRCTTLSLRCAYELPPGPVPWPPKVAEVSRRARAPPPAKGLPAPDWYIPESLYYYFTVMSPMHEFQAPGDGTYDFNHSCSELTRHNNFEGESFAMEMLLHRVQCLHSARGVVDLRRGGLPGLGELWVRLFYFMGLVLTNLNEQLLGGDHCPITDQIKNMANWPDDDVVRAYSHSGFHTFPCPTPVLQAMIRITHLRTLVAENKDSEKWESMARDVREKIASADPYRWNEGYKTDHEFLPVAARIYKASVALYALLSLPKRLGALLEVEEDAPEPEPKDKTTVTAAAFPHDDALDLRHAAIEADRTQSHRSRYTSRLFRLFRRALVEMPPSGGLIWPAAVLGVALQQSCHHHHHHPYPRPSSSPERKTKKDAYTEEHTIVLAHVAYLRGWPASENGATALHHKLVEFWASGKAGWEDCYYEPTNLMT